MSQLAEDSTLLLPDPLTAAPFNADPLLVVSLDAAKINTVSLDASKLPEASEDAPHSSVKPLNATVLASSTLAGGVVLLLASTVLQRVAGFAREFGFCRCLSADELGLWDMAFGFLMLAGPMAVMSLPGTFGRYAERYRQLQQLRLFLKRTALFCTITSLVAIAAILAARGWFSYLIFGTRDHVDMIFYLAGGLFMVVAFNYLNCLTTSLRNMRLVSLVELVNSVLFSVLGLGLLATGHSNAQAMILAYCGACLVSATISFAWLLRSWKTFPQSNESWPVSEICAKLAPLALWLMVSNFLWNLFDVVDRYMILHLAHGTTTDALAEIGNYRSSRVLPLLLSSITMMISGVVLPHLTHDWEAGRRDRVSNQLNLFVKVWAFILTCGAAIVLLFAPTLFRIGFHSKFTGGLNILPLTLTYCTWFGLCSLMQSYLFCAEKAAWASLVALIGVIVNVVLNFLWLPTMGLPGAVLATAVANFTSVVVMVILCRRCGFQAHRGALIALLLPVAVPLGAYALIALLLGIAVLAGTTGLILSHKEKQDLRCGIEYIVGRYLTRRNVASGSA